MTIKISLLKKVITYKINNKKHNFFSRILYTLGNETSERWSLRAVIDLDSRCRESDFGNSRTWPKSGFVNRTRTRIGKVREPRQNSIAGRLLVYAKTYSSLIMFIDKA